MNERNNQETIKNSLYCYNVNKNKFYSNPRFPFYVCLIRYSVLRKFLELFSLLPSAINNTIQKEYTVINLRLSRSVYHINPDMNFWGKCIWTAAEMFLLRLVFHHFWQAKVQRRGVISRSNSRKQIINLSSTS